MTHRALIAALAALSTLAGCSKETPSNPAPAAAQATPAPVAQVAATAAAKPDYVCKKNGKCDVAVTVKDCTPDGIVLDFPAIGVERGNTDVDITWTIATAGYDFAADGVKFKDSAQKEFKDGKASKNKFTWHDLNPQGPSQGRAFPYTVTIVKSGGAACAAKDPTVINDI